MQREGAPESQSQAGTERWDAAGEFCCHSAARVHVSGEDSGSDLSPAAQQQHRTLQRSPGQVRFAIVESCCQVGLLWHFDVYCFIA